MKDKRTRKKTYSAKKHISTYISCVFAYERCYDNRTQMTCTTNERASKRNGCKQIDSIIECDSKCIQTKEINERIIEKKSNSKTEFLVVSREEWNISLSEKSHIEQEKNRTKVNQQLETYSNEKNWMNAKTNRFFRTHQFISRTYICINITLNS